MFKRPAAPDPVAQPDVADASNEILTARRKRLESGGRNSTYLASIAPQSAATQPTKTLTGLQP